MCAKCTDQSNICSPSTDYVPAVENLKTVQQKTASVEAVFLFFLYCDNFFYCQDIICYLHHQFITPLIRKSSIDTIFPMQIKIYHFQVGRISGNNISVHQQDNCIYFNHFNKRSNELMMKIA